MLKRCALLCVAAGLCSGVTCTIRFPDGGGSGGWSASYVPLDEADAVVTIYEREDDAEADVWARITGRLGLTLDMERGQSVSVNSLALSGASGGYYRRSVPVADSYTVTVNEPTRGVLDTTIGSPGAGVQQGASFVIRSPTLITRTPVSRAGSRDGAGGGSSRS